MPNRWFTSVRNEIRFNRILNWRGNKILVQPLLYKKWQKKKKELRHSFYFKEKTT
jgi:hypothetical protein